MGEKKVTVMVLKVELDCEKCRKKVKKVLCRTPQVQDQVWDEKKNTVTVRVLCCSPEKIKDKIRYKGGDSIKGIDIVVPKPPEKPKESAEKPKAAPEKQKESEKPKAQEKPKEAEKPKASSEKPKEAEKPKEKPKDSEKPKESGKPKESAEKPKEPEKAPAPAPAPAPKPVEPAPGSVPVGHVQAVQAYPFPIGMSCSCPHCYGGVPGGPYCYGYGGPPAPQYYQYDGGYIGRPVYDSYGNGGGRGYTVSRNDYFSEENPQSCSIM